MRRLFIYLLIALVVGVSLGWGYQAYISHQQDAVNLELKGPYQHDRGHGWMAFLPQLAKWADDDKTPEFSTLIVYENGRPLGPAHSVHHVIRNTGQGSFAHWKHSLFFSTSDNSDPNQNGRKYSITVTAPSYRFLIVKEAIHILLGLVLAGAVAALAFMAMFSEGIWIKLGLLSAGMINFSIIVVLLANMINPLSGYGRILYILMFLTLLVFFTGCFLIFHEVRENGGLTRLKKAAFTVITVWSMVGTFFLLLEVFFRIFPTYDTMALNPGVRFFWPDYVSYPVNSMGYRDRSFSLDKSPSTYRIMVVGDSFTEGAGCSRREAFPGVLEEELRHRLQTAGCPHRVEVYNLGRCGANTVEEVATILKDIPVLKPDLIILAYVLNDPEVHPPDIKTFDPPAWVNDAHKVFLEEIHSYAYYGLFTKVTLFKGSTLTAEEFIAAIHDPNYHGWIEAKNAIVNLSKYLNKQHEECIAVIFPEFGYRNYPPKVGRMHDQIHQMMSDNGLEVIDLLNFYEGIDKNLRVFSFSAEDSHPSAKAHNLLGKYLAEVIGNRESFIRFRDQGEWRGRQVGGPRS